MGLPSARLTAASRSMRFPDSNSASNLVAPSAATASSLAWASDGVRNGMTFAPISVRTVSAAPSSCAAPLAAHFPAASGNPTNVLLRFPAPVWTDPAPLARAESQFISPDGRTVLFNVGLSAGDPDSNAALHQLPAIRAAVAAVAHDAGAAYGVAGDAPASYDVSHASDSDLLHIIPVAII